MSTYIRIDRVVGLYELWLDDNIPFSKMKVKVLQRSEADFLAIPNLAVRNQLSKLPEYISGLGKSEDEAFKDLLDRFTSEVQAQMPSAGFTEDDFEWSAPEEF